ncbi:MAG: 1-acyl-sn-glycerol-3-phosphate acyltransferase [Paludibacteraceae bacterium]|nr:1-acyl-sn-glycerol-3-phosphate acyltransferase [Paludibacteraceae bacterium]
MARIQDKDKVYEFFRPFVDWMFRQSYRRFQYVGRENIPTDGAIIFAPNHTNALCDALCILGIDGRRKVFVARADIFKNPKRAKLLNFFKIMPINRVRDGLDEVRKNDETLDKAVEVLNDDVPFCILPEGTHRPKHSLLPLSKGIFRIALRANEKFGDQKPVYIVPVGLEYGDYFHLWDSLTVNIGKPINVTQFVEDIQAKATEELTQPQIINALRDELTLRMREQIMWVPDDEHYEENIQKLQENPPAPFDKFKKHRIPRWVLLIGLILLSPIFVICAAVTLPIWLIWFIIRGKIKDPAFHNSVQYLWQLICIPLLFFIQAPFWMFFQEYLYQVRKFRRAKE